MDLTYSPEQEAFRAEARGWLEAHVPDDPLPSLDTADGFEAHRAWERTMFEDRWSVVSWPAEEYGGRDVGIFEWLVFEEEYYRVRAPTRVSQNGIFLLAPTMLEYGTEAQKEAQATSPRWLRATKSGVRAGPSPTPAATWPASVRGRRATRRATAGSSTAREDLGQPRRLRPMVFRHLPAPTPAWSATAGSPTSSSPWTRRASP